VIKMIKAIIKSFSFIADSKIFKIFKYAITGWRLYLFAFGLVASYILAIKAREKIAQNKLIKKEKEIIELSSKFILCEETNKKSRDSFEQVILLNQMWSDRFKLQEDLNDIKVKELRKIKQKNKIIIGNILTHEKAITKCDYVDVDDSFDKFMRER